MSLSVKDRKKNIDALRNTEFQLLIIGGGVTGAGIALEAASRGIKVALIEKDDFGFGTSSRSTKLIHGGLRYLKQFQFGLVRSVGMERKILLRNAPHLVRPETMLLPLYKSGQLSSLSASVGLKIYEILAGVSKAERRKMLNKADTLKQEPGLNPDGLLGSGLYYEYQTDDARLTMELIKTASREGALCLSYIKAYGFSYDNDGKIIGLRAHDCLEEDNFDLSTTQIINATGPWVDDVRKMDSDLDQKRLHHTKGIHLVFDHGNLPLKQAAYFDLPDGRMCFAIPRRGKTYVGTTDTNYFDDLDHPPITLRDAEYLLEGLRKIFPDNKCSLETVESSWSGVRPLIHKDGKAPGELSRKDEIFHSPTGMISIAGGKLTGYRKMAEKAVRVGIRALAKKGFKGFSKKSLTRDIKLGRTKFENLDQVALSKVQLEGDFKKEGIEETEYHKLWDRYGMECRQILEKMKEKDKSLSSQDRLLFSELDYCMDHEACFTPMDYIIRRSGLLYYDHQKSKDIFEKVSDYLAKALDSSTESVEKWKIEMAKRWHEAKYFD